MNRTTLAGRSLALSLVTATSVFLAGCVTETVPERPVETGAAAPETFDDPDLGTVAVYEVSAGADLFPAPDAAAQSVWDLFVDVATAEEIDEKVVEYDVGNAPESDTLAYVIPVSDDNTEWAFAANLAFADDEDLLRSTVVHEYGHLISLSSDQLEYGVADCDTLDLSEGCAYEDATIYAFYRDFWEQYGENAPGSDNDDPDIAYDFYLEHEDAFVSDYAATNVTEDFAETFMTFVLEDEPEGDSAVAEKILFFWDREGEAERRERIRTALGMG